MSFLVENDVLFHSQGGNEWTVKWHTTSSMISLIAAQQRIIDSGTAVVYRPVGETPGICYTSDIRSSVNVVVLFLPVTTAMHKKKIFEYFRNCSKRNFGRKDKIEYLLVLIRLGDEFGRLRSTVNSYDSFRVIIHRGMWGGGGRRRKKSFISKKIAYLAKITRKWGDLCPIAKKKAHVLSTNRRKVNVPRRRGGIFYF